MPASAVRLTTDLESVPGVRVSPGVSRCPVSGVLGASYDGRRSRVTYRRNLLRGYNSIQAKI